MQPLCLTFDASDGYPLRYRLYPAAVPARADIVYLHGIQSHAGWYGQSSSWFAERGFEVAFLDRRGSGANQAARGDTPSFRRLLADVAEFIVSRRSLHPGRPLILLTVSWGGKLGIAVQRFHPGLATVLILLTPGLFPRVGMTLRQRLAILWSRLTNPTKKFPIPLSDPQLFTATPRWLEFLRTDPQSLHEATARFLIESVRLDGYTRRAPPFVNLPTLLLLAGRDQIIDNQRTRDFVQRFPGAVTLHEFPEAHHTFEFEPDPEPIFQEILAWIDKSL